MTRPIPTEPENAFARLFRGGDGGKNSDLWEWTGKYETVVGEDWYCPSMQEWTMCPGPCPDGTPHGPKRTTSMQAKVMRQK